MLGILKKKKHLSSIKKKKTTFLFKKFPNKVLKIK